MSCTTAVMLQDRLNDIERNICDGIDFRQELNEAYALADELEDENAKLIVKLNAEHIVRQNVEAENARLTEVARRIADAESTAPRIRIHVDERRAIGHDECGRCGATVGFADVFCRMCGARLEGCL